MRAQAPKRPARWRLAAHAASCRSAAGTVTVPAVSGRVLRHILGKKMHLQWEIEAFLFLSTVDMHRAAGIWGPVVYYFG